MTNPKPSTVDEYIAVAPMQAREKLHEIRAILKEVAPNAKEAIKWGQPLLEEKRILFAYSAHKTHINFMPTRSTVDVFKAELANYTIGRDTIQLPYNQPLPKELIVKIAAHRTWDVRENDSRWM